jgi:hypothetical protein
MLTESVDVKQETLVDYGSFFGKVKRSGWLGINVS